MSLLKAAQHYGSARKKYRFEMKIHRLILPTSNRQLSARILWCRRKKRTENYKTSWIEGTQEFVITQTISHNATIFMRSNTNEMQSKYSKISIEIMNGNGAEKETKYCSFKLNLSDFINMKIVSKHLKYKNNSGTKKAEIIFEMKSTEITNDNDSVISEDGSNISAFSTASDIKQKQKQKHKQIEIQKQIETDDDDEYRMPIIIRRNTTINTLESMTTTTNTTHSHEIEENDNELSDHDDPHVHPPPFIVQSIAGSAISICTTSSEDEYNDDLLSQINYYREKMKSFEKMNKKLSQNQVKMSLLKENVNRLQKDNARLQTKIASLQTVIEHKNNEIYNSFSRFQYLSFEECGELCIADYIDHRDETGHFLFAKIINIDRKKHYVYIHYEGWAKKWDIWINLKRETKLNRIAPPRSISRKSNTRFIDVECGDNIDINPTQRHKGWKMAKIKKMDKYSGQIQCQYTQENEKYFYWAHLNDQTEIAPAMTKSCDTKL